MDVINNYSKYRKLKPQYKEWKNERNITEAKRAAYLKSNGVSDVQKQEDIKRALAVLNAVDIMDEYSQTRAENAELTSQGVITTVSQTLSFVGMAAGFGLMFIPGVAKNLAKIGAKFKIGEIAQIIPTAVGMIGPLIATPFLVQWGAKQEMAASRAGRYEAMQKDLNSPNHFATLTDAQEKELEEIAKSIVITEEEAEKKVQGTTVGLGGIIKAFKELFVKDKEVYPQREKLNKQIEEDRAKFETHALSAKGIEDAKKDQQLIGNVVEKIDIASQDYSENVEFAVGVINTVALAGGGVLGLGVNKLLSLFKFKNAGTPKVIAAITGVAAAIGISLLSVKLEKQASRVARFKVKEDFKKNPEKIIYVDDEKLKDVQNYELKQEKKKNPIRFIIDIFKDNKEYNAYLKERNIQDKQRRKALEQIQLTEAQEQEAKRLQTNVFKTFNEVDEKSQTYAESTEAVGDIVKTYGSLAMLGLGALAGALIGKCAGKMKIGANTKEMVTLMAPMAGMFASFIPIIGMDAYVTKEQKNSSRVADMLGLEELKDHRNYADYSDTRPKGETTEAPKMQLFNFGEQANIFKNFFQNK